MLTLRRWPVWRPLGTLRLACTLVLLSSLLAPSRSARASDSILKEDHNHRRLDIPIDVSNVLEQDDLLSVEVGEQNELQYEANFFGSDSGLLGKRATDAATAVDNNVPDNLNLKPGAIMYYKFEQAQMETPGEQGIGLPSVPFTSASTGSQLAQGDATPNGDDDDNVLASRQMSSSKVVYLSINTCLQPKPNSPLSGEMPQLVLYVSTSTSNTSPGPGKDDSLQQAFPLNEGYAAANVSASDTVYFSVAAPNVTSMTNVWNYEVAASIDDYFHGYNDYQQPGKNTPLLLTVDADSTSALLVTQNITNTSTPEDINQKWMQYGNPFALFAFNNDSLVNGVRNSYCGLRMAQSEDSIQPNTTITTRGLGGLPKGQFYLQNLQSSTQYMAMMAMNGNSTATGAGVVGGGGKVWPEIKVTTNQGMICLSLFIRRDQLTCF